MRFNYLLLQMRIIIIDDDPIARMLAQKFLQIKGFQGDILMAKDGFEGIERIEESYEKTIVLLDYHMPGLNGVGVLRYLQKVDLPVKVFMVTSSTLDSNKRISKSYGMVVDYLVKPINPQHTQIIFNEMW